MKGDPVTWQQLRTGIGTLRLVARTGQTGVVTDAYTTNVGKRLHATLRFDDGTTGPVLLGNLRHVPERPACTCGRPKRRENCRCMCDRCGSRRLLWETVGHYLDKDLVCQDCDFTQDIWDC